VSFDCERECLFNGFDALFEMLPECPAYKTHGIDGWGKEKKRKNA
jgi:hypothetical protein